MTGASFKWKFCCSVVCAVWLRWRKRSFVKPRRAATCARRWQPNGKRCANSKLCRQDGPRNPTVATSFGSAVASRAPLANSKALTTEDAGAIYRVLTWDAAREQYGVVRHVAIGHNGTL